jgi:hypothetical protein
MVDALKERIANFKIEAKGGNDELLQAQARLLESLEKKLADIESREIALWESQLDPETKMPPNVIRVLTARLEKEREETEKSLEKARAEMVTPIDYEKQILTFQQALDALLDEKMSVADKNHLLKKCVEKITYHREPAQKILGKGNGRGYFGQPIQLKVHLKL